MAIRSVKTPAFDRIAAEGLRFVHSFCNAPTCGPSRSAILTGQPIWRLEEAGNIHSTLPAKFATYTEELQKAGYIVASTGKGWGPGRLGPGGRTEQPAGTPRHGRTLKPPFSGIQNIDYAGNFDDFVHDSAAMSRSVSGSAPSSRIATSSRGQASKRARTLPAWSCRRSFPTTRSSGPTCSTTSWRSSTSMRWSPGR